MFDPLEQKQLRELHKRLVNGDRVASGELFRLLLDVLMAEVGRKFPYLDDQLVSDGVTDAVLDYCSKPQQFDTGTDVPLDRFLALAAWRNVANLLVGDQRRKRRERQAGGKKREADVALDPLVRNIKQEEQIELGQKRAALFAVLKTESDRQILTLWLDGVKETDAFVPILKIAHLPLDQQRAEVKRHKDRIIRFLRRRGLLT